MGECSMIYHVYKCKLRLQYCFFSCVLDMVENMVFKRTEWTNQPSITLTRPNLLLTPRRLMPQKDLEANMVFKEIGKTRYVVYVRSFSNQFDIISLLV